MAETHEMKVGNLTPELTVTLLQPDEKTPVAGLNDGIAVRFFMKGDPSDAVALIAEDATWVDSASAKVKYSWRSGDTNAEGRFYGEFRITVAGKDQTFPNKKFIVINMNGNLE